MKFTDKLNQWTIGLVSLTLLIIPSISSGAEQQSAIESGQYFQGQVYYSTTNSWFVPVDYMFEATSNETVIVRVANESDYYDAAPQCAVYAPPDGTGTNLASSTNALFCNEVQLTNLPFSGWYRISVTQITNVAHWVSHDFSVSFLRLPNAPLSYADTDVGAIHRVNRLRVQLASAPTLMRPRSLFPTGAPCRSGWARKRSSWCPK